MRLETTPVFTKNYHSDKFITVNRGGTRSSKSRSLVQIALLWLMTGTYSTQRPPILKGVWSTVRKFASTLEGTIIRDLEEEIDQQNIGGLIDRNLTKKTYRYQGRILEFIGADDEQKLRGAKRNILYCNEANELGFKDEFFQLLMRTEDKIFIDFNPDDADVWINTEIEQKRVFEKKDTDVIVSTFRDNTFLPKRMVEEIEYLKDTDPDFWKVYGLGEYGRKVGLIFTHWKLCDELPEGGDTYYGLDFGFTNPTALVKVVTKDKCNYVKEILYKAGLTNSDLIEVLHTLNLGHSVIYADAAEPQRIEEINRAGFNIRPAEKGKDSVKKGIDTVKSMPLYITSDSVNLLKEIRKYSWQTGKDGKPSPEEPVKFDDHQIDSMRYAIHTNNIPSGWWGSMAG